MTVKVVKGVEFKADSKRRTHEQIADGLKIKEY